MSTYRETREITALEQRIGFLEDQRREWAQKSFSAWQLKLEKIERYDRQLRSLMDQHPELKEAWDSFVCLYQLAANGNKELLKQSTKTRKGCYSCWTEDEIANHLEELRKDEQ